VQLTRTAGSQAAKRAATGPFITVSRAAGSGGSSLALSLASRLNTDRPEGEPRWTVFDRQIVEKVLEDNQLSTRLARYLPEDRVPEIEASVRELVGLHPNLWTLLRKTTETIRDLARLGHVILVGRGANFAARGVDRGLHVRLVGTEEARARHTARIRNIDLEAAAAWNRRTDAARRDYVRSAYETDVDDVTAYDLTLNTGTLALSEAADLVVQLLRARNWV
jgi:cytidylate kinase